jgi:spermidine synthase
MTPYFGVSLYIWASILSTTLFFLAIGYYFGGIVTHRVTERRVLSLYCAAPAISAISLLLSAYLYPVSFPGLARWSLVAGSFVACLIILSIPLALMSALNPLLVAIERNRRSIRRDHSGHDDAGAGVVFFISTLGSVIGVVFAAFILIPNMRNTTSLVVSAIALSLVSLVLTMATPELSRRSRLNLTLLAVGGAILGCVSFLGLSEYTSQHLPEAKRNGMIWKTVASEPSTFGNLKVVDIYKEQSAAPIRRLLINDGMIQNGVDGNGKSIHLFTYALEELAIAAAPQAETALVLGMGGGIVPSNLVARGIKVDAVEINPKMVDIAREFFAFDGASIDIAIEDVRTFIHRCSTNYDIAVIDLTWGDGVPEHLVTKEFLGDVKACLRPNGVMVMNLIYYPLDTAPLRSLAATLVDVFGKVRLLQRPSRTADATTNGFFLAANGAIPKVMKLDPNVVPDFLKILWSRTLRTATTIDRDSALVKNAQPISDENNRWMILTVASNQKFRNTLRDIIPDPILAN